MEKNVLQQWDGVEKRTDEGDRREEFSDRRSSHERRFDYREANPPAKRSIKSWVRSLSNARLGVDRRKGTDRRIHEDRRSMELQSILTPEELAALLQE
jgi:hypothetical protein